AGIGALIYGFMPQDLLGRVAGPDNFFAVPIAAVIGIPMYIRAESIIPIGMTLLGKGMAMGTVAALVIGGAGASIPEVTLLASIFKPRLVGAFVVVILVIACITGYVFNFAFK
ncbi:MAG: permease, partial [Heliobacteriaceae bacterium]|nr:permease [Heliobacteriaceae bacterium]